MDYELDLDLTRLSSMQNSARRFSLARSHAPKLLSLYYVCGSISRFSLVSQSFRSNLRACMIQPRRTCLDETLI